MQETSSLLISAELTALLIVGAGFALILGSPAIAKILLGLMIATLFLPILIPPLLSSLPAWLLIGLFIFLCLVLLRTLFNLLLGKGFTDHYFAILAADLTRFAFLAPFRVIAWIIRSARR